MSRQMVAMTNPALLEPLQNGVLQVVIETPRGSRNKYAWDGVRGCFALKKILPAGMGFPFDFGFVPQTRAQDGGEIDALVLMEEPAFTGCVLGVRLVGAIQQEDHLPDGRTLRNDRLLCVAEASATYASAHHVEDLPVGMVEQLCSFFEAYPRILRMKESRVLGVSGPAEAMRLIDGARVWPKR